ncbi:cytochrome c4 [Pseudomonas sp. CFBP 8770]|uniref:c-type cytochrome n=1 Tax=unclassified Pseudomonas TaxID=196821 RepID=UPI0017869828|nr:MULTISPECIES: c-type cytochrome [unclassified Pseudomonas]MBD8475713.1 cytochrome c4 [Pseudomonas sp. CFBP 8773]MBD8648177.1 cytochrome c4 [Pseudomonas sp. CFBP 8770]
MSAMRVMGLLCALLASSAASAAGTVGDGARGQPLTTLCAACHGPNGNSLVPIFPKLAGQGERYLNQQLLDIRENRRVVPEMAGTLAELDDQDLLDIAAWYAEQTPTATEVDAVLVQRGQDLYRGGDQALGVPACSGCHAPDGAGTALAGFPQLRGQHAPYLIKRLAGFRQEGDATAIMHSIAGRLNDDDIAALATYIQALR